ncbi:MAG: beta-ketoacyl synthase N-terminal-like domain-containing protein, partial [Pseudomonadota bacterium]|nr:beta-ketoacyl synthase N-terminal-like domain-containing protein [Pseudomonadota bacterium]
MRHVAITGMGIVSSIGNNAQEVTASLAEGRSGIRAEADQIEKGFRSQVAGRPTLDIDTAVDKRVRRFMGAGAA